ncbi:hypothetical protein E2562_009424 [Oryza meyeriana var. granulata]|uniref:Uncharacterized protein n=1 Tax=Oryza meyeriana var. granulata TaxID=110450 RepID=A0A6G1BTN7_9ORYZ|nr:hypothetical protein E2562_009424 [Oryza meyeriana var. granulata]
MNERIEEQARAAALAAAAQQKNNETQAETVVETPMGMNNNVSDEPTAVNTPSLGGEHVQQTVVETPMAMNNNVYDEPTAVNTPSLGEHVQQNLTESVLSTQNSQQSGRFTRSTANKSLFPNDKGNNAPGKFISTHTLRNNAASKKREMRNKGGKIQLCK